MLVAMAMHDCYLHILAHLRMPTIAALENTTGLMRPATRKAVERLNAMRGTGLSFGDAEAVVGWARRMQWVRLAVARRA